MACISTKKTCRSNLSPDGKKLVESYKQFTDRINPANPGKAIGEWNTKHSLSYTDNTPSLRGLTEALAPLPNYRTVPDPSRKFNLEGSIPPGRLRNLSDKVGTEIQPDAFIGTTRYPNLVTSDTRVRITSKAQSSGKMTDSTKTDVREGEVVFQPGTKFLVDRIENEKSYDEAGLSDNQRNDLQDLKNGDTIASVLSRKYFGIPSMIKAIRDITEGKDKITSVYLKEI